MENTSPLNMGPNQNGTSKKVQNENDINNEQTENHVESFSVTPQDENLKSESNEMKNKLDSFNITDQVNIEGQEQNKVNGINITEGVEIEEKDKLKLNSIDVTSVEKIEPEPGKIVGEVNDISVSNVEDIKDELIKGVVKPEEAKDEVMDAKVKPDEEKKEEKEKEDKSKLDNTKVPEATGHYEEENAGTFHWGIVLTSLCLLCPLGGGLAFLFAPAQAASVGLIPFSKDMKRKVFVVDNVNSDTSKLIGPVTKDKSEVIGKKKRNEDALFSTQDFIKALQKKPIEYIEESLKNIQGDLKEKYGDDFAKFKKDHIDLINKNNPENKEELLNNFNNLNSFDDYINYVKEQQNESFQQIGVDPNKTFEENGIDKDSLVKIQGDPENMLSVLKAARAFSEAKPLNNNINNNVNNLSNSNSKGMGGRG